VRHINKLHKVCMLPASCVLSMHACTCSTCSSSSYATPFGKTNKKKKGLSALKFFFKKSNFVWIYHQKKILAVERNFSSCLCAVLQACRALLLLLPSFQGSMLCPQLFCCSTSNFPPYPQTHPPPSNPPQTNHKILLKKEPLGAPPLQKKTPKQNLNNSQGISKLTKDKSLPLPHRILTFPSYLRNKTQPHPHP